MNKMPDYINQLDERDFEGPEDYPDADDPDEFCLTCYGSGIIITCWDDICANSDHCFHGDGEKACPDCDNWMWADFY